MIGEMRSSMSLRKYVGVIKIPRRIDDSNACVYNEHPVEVLQLATHKTVTFVEKLNFSFKIFV